MRMRISFRGLKRLLHDLFWSVPILASSIFFSARCLHSMGDVWVRNKNVLSIWIEAITQIEMRIKRCYSVRKWKACDAPWSIDEMFLLELQTRRKWQLSLLLGYFCYRRNEKIPEMSLKTFDTSTLWQHSTIIIFHFIWISLFNTTYFGHDVTQRNSVLTFYTVFCFLCVNLFFFKNNHVHGVLLSRLTMTYKSSCWLPNGAHKLMDSDGWRTQTHFEFRVWWLRENSELFVDPKCQQSKVGLLSVGVFFWLTSICFCVLFLFGWTNRLQHAHFHET